MKLSVIIPVYNVEKYVEKTLRSVLNQDIDKALYEIIVVNDGSPDNSTKIIQTIINEGNDIKLLNQSNQGLSEARNNGMRLAKGEYIWFIDSDDWIEENCLSSLVEYMDGSVDEIILGASTTSEDGSKILGEKNRFPLYHKRKLSGKKCWAHKIPHVAIAQFAIYRTDFLRENHMSFIKGIYHEDFDFCIKASYLSKQTLFLDGIFYYLRQNPYSITRTVNPKKSYDYIVVAQSLRRFVYENVNEKNIITLFHHYISMAINNSLNNICNSSAEVISKYEDYLRNNDEIFNSLIASKELKYVFEGIMFKFFGKKFISIYNLLSSFPIHNLEKNNNR